MWYWPQTVLQFLMGYSDLVTVFACIFFWEYFTKTALSAETKWSLYAGAFLAISFRNWRKEKKRADAAEAALAAEKGTVKPERIFAEEPEGLIAHLGDPKFLTGMQVVRYIDKWITVAGAVEGSADSLAGDATYVTLLMESGRRVNLRFSAMERDQLRKLRKGQHLTAVCQIRPSYSQPGAALENCELVRLGPLRAILARAS